MPITACRGLCVYFCLKETKQKNNNNSGGCMCRCVCLYAHVCFWRCVLLCLRLGSSSNDQCSTHSSVSPCWRISVALNACYHGNRLPAYRSGTQTMVSLSLSLSFHPCCSTRHLPNLLSHPPHLLFSPFFSVSCLDFHPSMSVFPVHASTPPPLLSHSFHSHWRFYLSQFIHVNLAAMLSHLCLFLSFHHSLHLSHHPLFPFIQPCVYLCMLLL